MIIGTGLRIAFVEVVVKLNRPLEYQVGSDVYTGFASREDHRLYNFFVDRSLRFKEFGIPVGVF